MSRVIITIVDDQVERVFDENENDLLCNVIDFDDYMGQCPICRSTMLDTEDRYIESQDEYTDAARCPVHGWIHPLMTKHEIINAIDHGPGLFTLYLVNKLAKKITGNKVYYPAFTFEAVNEEAAKKAALRYARENRIPDNHAYALPATEDEKLWTVRNDLIPDYNFDDPVKE